MVFQIDNIPMVPDEPNSFFVDFLGYKMKIYIFESIWVWFVDNIHNGVVYSCYSQFVINLYFINDINTENKLTRAVRILQYLKWTCNFYKNEVCTSYILYYFYVIWSSFYYIYRTECAMKLVLAVHKNTYMLHNFIHSLYLLNNISNHSYQKNLKNWW